MREPAAHPSVVLDVGSAFVKCGFSGERTPRAVFDTGLLKPAHKGNDQRSRYSSNLEGCRSWGDVQLAWDHAFHNELRIEPSEHRLLLADMPLGTPACREQALQSAFETHGFASVNMQAQAILSLMSVGQQTGLVVDVGEDATYAVAVIDGSINPGCSHRLPVGGRLVTQRLQQMMQHARSSGATSRHDALSPSLPISMAVARAAKEQLCYIAPDLAKEEKLVRETSVMTERYVLPDGRRLTLGPERFRAPEVLFSPSLVGCEAHGGGLADVAFACISESSVDARRTLFENIVLCGGGSMCPGLASRLQAEVAAMHSGRMLKGAVHAKAVHVNAAPSRAHAVFSGGSVLGSIMDGHDAFWVTRAQWGEDPHRALRMCSGGGA